MKNSQGETALLIGVGSVIVGLWLMSRPKCNRGCRTMAEHLVEHGIEDLVSLLFA